MSIEAMKQALEALNCIKSPLHVREMRKLGEAMKTLRQAIAEAEKQEPVAWREIMGKWKTHYYDYNEDGRGEPLYAAPVYASDIPQERVDETTKDRHISYVCPNCHWSLNRQPDYLRDATKKVWVGLDYKQMRNTTLQFNHGALWAERYLREKNNG